MNAKQRFLAVANGALLFFGVAATAWAQSGVGGGLAPGSSMVPYRETEFRNKLRWGTNATEDWRSQRDFYNLEYRPRYYYLSNDWDRFRNLPRYRYYRDGTIMRDRVGRPIEAPEYHDYSENDRMRLRQPAYSYPSDTPGARIYRDYNWR